MNVDDNRLVALSDAVMDVARGEDLKTSLRRLVENAVVIVDCMYGALGALGLDGTLEEFTYVGISEESADEIASFPEGKGLLGHLLEHPQPLRVKEIREHPASVGFPEGHPSMAGFLGVPIRIRDEVYGSLYLTQKRNGEEFTEEDEQLVIVLASAAGVAIDSYRGHIAQSQMSVLAERERIARDLHDLVIQRLFATGMVLQTLGKRNSLEIDDAERIQESVDNLDHTISQIRNTIFELQAALPLLDIRSQVVREVDALHSSAGFQIRCEFEGPVNVLVSPELAAHIIPVIRELITNAIRHAGATDISLLLSTNKTYCVVTVTDNGKGFVASHRKSGLLNLESRALERQGSFEIFGMGSAGTKAVWQGSL